ncbi:N-acetyltransferase [Candidatus Pacearchaeota archaeon]|nr:N-acetyltransferase [Candidatus Pacearchaeota archaeon]
MKIVTKRLILRDLKKTDAKDIQINANNLNVSRFLAVVPFPYTLKNADSFIKHCITESKNKPRVNYALGIELNNEKRIIGMISITKIDKFNGTATMGYWIGEKYWRNGYGSESLKAIIEFFFKKLKLRRIDISAASENEASNSLIKKMGFIYEGLRIKNSRAKSTGELHDINSYGMLKENWKG